MRLDAREVAGILRQKGVTKLYHANTVATSSSFLPTGSLLARGALAERELVFTPQKTDSLDKELGLWWDVFMDPQDIHQRARRRNCYGPVLLCFDMSILESRVETVWLTKTNPKHWTSATPDDERYFQSTEDLRRDYRYGDFSTMLILRETRGALELAGSLHEIIVDAPHRELKHEHVYEHAIRALRQALRAGGLNGVALRRRVCQSGCRCREQYDRMYDQTLSILYSERPVSSASRPAMA